MTQPTPDPAPTNPPPGTRSFALDGVRYDLIPHRSAQDTLLVERDAREPNRVRSSWISTGAGVASFMRNWGDRAERLPEGTPLEAPFLPLVARRLAEEREPIDIAGLLAAHGPR